MHAGRFQVKLKQAASSVDGAVTVGGDRILTRQLGATAVLHPRACTRTLKPVLAEAIQSPA
jgi:hypothetical protein